MREMNATRLYRDQVIHWVKGFLPNVLSLRRSICPVPHSRKEAETSVPINNMTPVRKLCSGKWHRTLCIHEVGGLSPASCILRHQIRGLDDSASSIGQEKSRF